jgi:hypothetical protein
MRAQVEAPRQPLEALKAWAIQYCALETHRTGTDDGDVGNALMQMIFNISFGFAMCPRPHLSLYVVTKGCW